MNHKLSILLSVTLPIGLFTGCLHEAPEETGPTTPSKTLANQQGGETAKSEEPADRAGKAEQPASRPTEKPAGDATGTEVAGTDYERFGAEVAAEGESMTLAAVAGKAAELEGKKVRLTGVVQTVCKSKGCWMMISDGEQSVRVTFKNYAFFVPKDCEGREAVLEGVFTHSETSVADLKHLLQDEGKHEEAAKVTEPQLEMKVKAAGVLLRKKS